MKKLLFFFYSLIVSFTLNAQSTVDSYTWTTRFFNNDFLQMYQGARLSAPTMTLPNSISTYTSTLPFVNTDNLQLYNAIRGLGDATSSFTNTSWNITGNAISTNTNFIGTTTNRSLRLLVNNNEIIKADSMHRVNIGWRANQYNPGALLSVVNMTGNCISGVSTRTETGYSQMFLGANTSTTASSFFMVGSSSPTSALSPYFQPNTAIDIAYASSRVYCSASPGPMIWLVGGELAANERMRIGTNNCFGINNTAPTKTVDINGNFRVVRGTSTVSIGEVDVSGFAGIWFNEASPTNVNQALGVTSGKTTILNSPSGTLFLRANDVSIQTINTGGTAITGTLSVSSTATINGTFTTLSGASIGGNLTVTGNITASTGTLTGQGLQLASGSVSVTSKSINTTPGDAATINSPTGRFRKDTSGNTFVLTNNLITTNSIIILTIVTTGVTTGYDLAVTANAGSATITFQTAGSGAAPNTDCDVNFWVIN